MNCFRVEPSPTDFVSHALGLVSQMVVTWIENLSYVQYF
jgi:hypothetical protein